MAAGFRILPRTRVVGPETVARFRDLPVANVSDVMSRMTAGGPRLRPMHAGGVLAGPAFTVKTRPGDNLMVHKALAMAEPGDVIVGDADGVIVLPRAMAEDVARAALAQEEEDAWIAEQVAAGHPVDGLFPMNAAWRAIYDARESTS